MKLCTYTNSKITTNNQQIQLNEETVCINHIREIKNNDEKF